MTLFKWSQTPATNSNVDSTINFAEGQAPSSVNDSARSLMAAVAKFRDDSSGNLETAGTSTAYTLSSNQVTTELLDGFSITARIHTLNGTDPTLNLDAQGAKPIRSYNGTAVPNGAMGADSVHTFVYDASDDCWYVHGFFLATTISLSGVDIHGATELASATMALTDELPFYDLSATANKRITMSNVIGSFVMSESQAGFGEMATHAEIWAATTGAKALMAEDLETAAAAVSLTDASTVAINWDNGINFEVTITANRILGNPTNGQPGTTRTVYVVGDSSTDRTLTFGNQYLGEVPTLTDIDNGRHYLLTIFCRSASHFIVSAKRAVG